MRYSIELDAGNLATWFKNNQSVLSPGTDNNTGFAVYFSDRRGEQIDRTNGGTTRTGDYGWYDTTIPADATNGCPT